MILIWNRIKGSIRFLYSGCKDIGPEFFQQTPNIISPGTVMLPSEIPLVMHVLILTLGLLEKIDMSRLSESIYNSIFFDN